jgi:hypothetical protein
MQRLECLLFDGLHGHRPNVTTPGGFEHRFGVRPVGLISPDVRAHVLDGQQARPQIARLTTAPPVVGRATGLHDHFSACVQPVDEAGELRARQSLPVDDSARAIRHRHFENVLCEIHRHRRSIHIGLLLVRGCDPRALRQILPRNNREESMPSMEPARANFRTRAAHSER